MRYHYNKALACDFLYQVHYLDGSVGIERARGFVGKQNFGIVDEGAGDCHPLHLAARKLVGALVQLGAEAYAVERLGCASLALFGAYAREREGEFDVGKHRLVRYQVIGLEYETYAVVAVGIPIAVLIIFGGDALDYKVARRVMVESADDVQKGGFAAARRAENRHELVAAERKAYALQSGDFGIAHLIVFGDVPQLKHISFLP